MLLYFCVFFCYFFMFSLICEYPLPRPLARFVPFVIDFGLIFNRFCRSCRTTKKETTKRRLPSVNLSWGPAECALALSAAPSGARRARLTVQVPVSFCQVLEFQILKFRFQIPSLDPCKTQRGFNLSLPLRQPRAFRRADPFCRSVAPLDRFFRIFLDLGPTFSGSKKLRKNNSSPNATKSQKSDPWVPKARFLELFWMTFGITFSISFPDRLNLVICNNFNAKTSF